MSPWNKNLIFASLVAAIGSGFQHGYHTGAPNTPKDVLTNWTSETVEGRRGSAPEESMLILLWGIAASLYCLGGVLGGLLTGITVTKFGRKGGMLVNNIVAVVALVLLCLSKMVKSFEMFVIGRFIIGVNGGLNGGICPMYLNEIAPTSIRGAVGSLYQLVITISILLAQFAGMNFTLGTKDLWPLIFFASSFIVIFQVIALLFCPESPKYSLATKNDEEKALKSLTWLRGGEDVSEEMKNLKAEIAESNSQPAVKVKDLFTVPTLRKPLTIALVIMLAQQFSGINAIIFYSTQMFQGAGLEGNNAGFATMGMGGLNVVMTVVSVFLVEIAGRKTLLLIGFIGMSIDTFLMTVFLALKISVNTAFGYPCIAVIMIFIVLFSAGAGSIPWFLVGEIFNQSARPAATSLAVGTNWFINFLVVLSFGPLEAILHGYVFLIFAVLNAVFAVFIIFIVPETKNKTIDEIQALFK